jgi:hypothetical protein
MLKQARGELSLDVVRTGRPDRGRRRLRSADGAWPLFGPVGPDDIAELAEMKRRWGIRPERARHPLRHGVGGDQRDLARPVTLTPANGGRTDRRPGGAGAYQAEPGVWAAGP